ncbi:MAG TPA: Na(+)/H(+) antiporter subunit F1 [Staphylococcus sp.]|nr:Na(+)/H(+) antiporter subunit F1 [Staphylococcus sp.]
MDYNIILIIALVIVALSMLGMLVRVIIGPSLADRVVALDAMGIQLMAIVALFSVFLGTKYLMVVILLIGILAFLGTAVFAKYMDKGRVIENDNDDSH